MRRLFVAVLPLVGLVLPEPVWRTIEIALALPAAFAVAAALVRCAVHCAVRRRN